MLPAVLLAASLSAGQPPAPSAELVSAKKIWDGATENTSPDIVRFNDRWFVACRESNGGDHDGTVRILRSADAETWDAVGRVENPTPTRGLYKPRLSATPDGRLAVSATALVPTPNVPDPLPRFGGTIQTLQWFTKDGGTWTDAAAVGPTDFPFDRLVWHKGTALGYARGCICGSMQTVRVFGGDGGKDFKSRYERTFSGFFPEDGALALDGDTAYCLMSRAGVTGRGNPPVGAMLGTSKAPFTTWDWKEMDVKVVSPNLLRLPDGRLLLTGGLADGKPRTSVCLLDPATGKLTELLVLPNAGVQYAGLAHHDGHVWATYHATENGKYGVHLAKLKVK